jgi:glycerophosphoryl diester phosphodiesterase
VCRSQRLGNTRIGSSMHILKRVDVHATKPSSDRCLRIAHSFVAPGCDPASIDARLVSQCDMVELDVLQYRGELVIAHDKGDCHHPSLLKLDHALGLLQKILPLRTGFNIDLKAAGYEREVVEILHARDLAARTLMSTMEVRSLPTLRELDPALRLGWSVPSAGRYVSHTLTRPLAKVGGAYYRRTLPGKCLRQILRGYADAIMANWRVVTSDLAEAVAAVGGDLYVWTVDDPSRFSPIAELGATGIITNDIRLFDVAVSKGGAGADRLRWSVEGAS